jgi:hypothetical protein
MAQREHESSAGKLGEGDDLDALREEAVKARLSRDTR